LKNGDKAIEEVETISGSLDLSYVNGYPGRIIEIYGPIIR
jgi:RecA/RadA recombinase